jgi:hypothetical protein
MTQLKGAVLAGSGAFTSALMPALMSRFGAGLRVTSDPDEALRHCKDAGGLLVVELLSDRWIPVFAQLRGAHAEDLRILVAVPKSRAAAVPALRTAGVDFDYPAEMGPAPALDALARIASGAPLGPPRPAAGPPGAGPALTPAPGFDDAPLLTPVPQEETDAGGPAEVVELDPFGAGAAALEKKGPRRTFIPSERWPGTVPTEHDAEHLLASSLAGLKPEGDALLDATLESLSTLETSALLGDPLEVDPDPLRRSAALRFRVASALTTVPAPGTSIDATAAGAILDDLDEVLAALKAMRAASPDRAAEVDAVQRALVKDAVDLSETVQRLSPLGATAVPVPASAPRTARAASTRLLTMETGEVAEREERRRWPLWIVAGLVIAGGAAFHLKNYLDARNAPPSQTLAGAPTHTIGMERGGSKILVADPGKTLDPAEIENFRRMEEAKGSRVEEVAPGTWVVKPGRAPNGPGGQP